jgi:hypothetical protein
VAGQRPSRLFAILGTSLAAVLPVQAQDGGLSYGFTFDEKFEYVVNPGFETPAAPSILSATTALGFSASSATQIDSLRFDLSYDLQALRQGGGGITIEPGRPHLSFGYSREAANAALDIGLSYDHDRIETLRPIEDFIGEDGVIILPEDPEDLVGSGDRLAYGAHARLELGREAPLGFSLRASMDRIDYADVTDPDLVDRNETSLGAALRLDLSPLTQASLGLSYDITEENNVSTTARSLDLGVTQALSPVLGLSGTLGYDIDTGETTLGADIDYALATGGLQLSLGLDDVALSWQQVMATSAISARASYEGGSVQTSVLALGYSHALSEISGVNFGLSYTDTQDPGANDVRRAELSASYGLSVSEDWALQAGLYYGLRDEESVGQSTSSALFVTLSRDFDFLR